MDEKIAKRIKRHKRIRKKILGTESRPRLSAYRALANLHAQLIDDLNARTLLYVSTLSKEFKKEMSYGGNVQAATLLGRLFAEQARKQGITEVVFDRGGFLYHGRIKAFAEACRKHGLKF